MLIFCQLSLGFLTSPDVRKFDTTPKSTCQLRLYGVEQFLGSNDMIDHNVNMRKRKNDKSLRTLGKFKFYLCTMSRYVIL